MFAVIRNGVQDTMARNNVQVREINRRETSNEMRFHILYRICELEMEIETDGRENERDAETIKTEEFERILEVCCPPENPESLFAVECASRKRFLTEFERI